MFFIIALTIVLVANHFGRKNYEKHKEDFKNTIPQHKIKLTIDKRYTHMRGMLFFMAAFVFTSMGLFHLLAELLIEGFLFLLSGGLLVLIGLSRLKVVRISEKEIIVNNFFNEKSARLYSWQEVNQYKMLFATMDTSRQLLLWMSQERIQINIRSWEWEPLIKLMKMNRIKKNKKFVWA